MGISSFPANVGIYPKNLQKVEFTSGIVVQDVYNTALDLTNGKGLLSFAVIRTAGSSSSRIRITIDGQTPIELNSSTSSDYYQFIPLTYFSQSLKIEGKNLDGTDPFDIVALYSII